MRTAERCPPEHGVHQVTAIDVSVRVDEALEAINSARLAAPEVCPSSGIRFGPFSSR
jgi:hypothetical protein